MTYGTGARGRPAPKISFRCVGPEARLESTADPFVLDQGASCHAPILSIALLSLTLPAHAGGSTLLVVESTGDTVMLVSAEDGSMVNPAFIDLSVAGASTPVEAIQVGNEIWISDQLEDTVFRFTADGTTYLGNATTGRDNMRGIALADGSFYAAQSGTGGAGYGDVTKEYQLDGTLVNQFASGDPFDVVDFGGSLLIADIAGEDILEFAYDGTPLGIFHDSDGVTGIDFPEQLSVRANGNVLAAGFSLPAGIYEYDSNGNEIAYIDVGSGVRGVHELTNGNILYTDGAGVHVYDTQTMTTFDVVTGVSGRFIAPGGEGLGTNYCTSTVNSSGSAASMSAGGTTSVAANNLVLIAEGLPANVSGIFFYGPNQIQAAFGNGFRCVGGSTTRRTIEQADATGTIQHALDNQNTPPQGTIVPGVTFNFQSWFRDAMGGGAQFNLSDGLEVTFTP